MRRRWPRIGREWSAPTARFGNDGSDGGEPSGSSDGLSILQENGDDLLQETGSELRQES